MTLSDRIKAEALALGFQSVGIVPAAAAVTHGFYADWLAAGHAGAMSYLHRHAPFKRHPESLLPGVRSVIAVALSYAGAAPKAPGGALRGRVARYAWGQDYHEVIREKLEHLAETLRGWALADSGHALAWRACVDTAPLLEREHAARAGLGWVGKNANLIHWEHGSWLLLGELLVNIALDPDPPAPPRAFGAEGWLPWRENCGSCTACIEACPTQAIVADKTVDSRRCISYLTIELKEPIPTPWRPQMGQWVFGCDLCQDVCPWNRRATPGREPALLGVASAAWPDLVELLELDEARFRHRFGDTPLARPRRRGLLRNAAIALGNALAAEPVPSGERAAALGALRRALADPEALVRGAAAWALGQGAPEAQPWLREALDGERDATVQEELRAALERLPPTRLPPTAGTPP